MNKNSKEEILVKMLPIVGMTSLRVYIQLVEQYMSAFIHGEPGGEIWFRPDEKYICKEEGIKPAKYYAILNNLVLLGFVEKSMIKKKLRWRISYDMMDTIL